MLRGLLRGGLLAFRRNIPTYRVTLRCSIPTAGWRCAGAVIALEEPGGVMLRGLLWGGLTGRVGGLLAFRRNIPTYRVALRCSVPTAA